ncbi:MAG: tripartite tricarboxylate transporter substrate binding protein [Hyphomicrobiales bacterium]|nr:tripartite tricarboxylate transporter substrate binding protein [Hyphomicrobiales bacterium]
MARAWLTVLLLLGIAAPCDAQDKWPSRQVTIVVPYGAGTAPDLFARIAADELSPRVGQPILVDNKAGSGGLIGTEFAAAAAPDGYTLFLGSIDTQAVIGHLHPNRKVDPVKALAPISLLARITDVVAASPVLDVKDMAELVAAAKNGRTFSFGTPGVGTNLHLLGELIKLRLGIDMLHVPYRVMANSYADAIAGRVDLIVAGVPPTYPFLKDNRLKALAVSSARRVPALPDTPTLVELGHPDLIFVGWFGLLAPAATPPDIVARLSQELDVITKLDRYRERLEKLLAEPASSSPGEFARFIATENARMKDIIDRAKIKVD